MEQSFNIRFCAGQVFVIVSMVMELFGLLGLLGLKMSAIPAVILIIAVGIGVEFTAHICMVSCE